MTEYNAITLKEEWCYSKSGNIKYDLVFFNGLCKELCSGDLEKTQ